MKHEIVRPSHSHAHTSSRRRKWAWKMHAQVQRMHLHSNCIVSFCKVMCLQVASQIRFAAYIRSVIDAAYGRGPI